MIVRGQVPLSVMLTLKVDIFTAQLSVIVPPPAIKAAYVANAGGMDPLHSKF